VVVGDFNTPLRDRSSRQNINKETLDLNDTFDQMDLTDIYRTFHPTRAQYTFFSAVHGTFSKIDQILGHKTSRNKYRKIELTTCILSDHNVKKKQNSTTKAATEYTKNWRLNTTFLNDQWS
jgi:exonuclease III